MRVFGPLALIVVAGCATRIDVQGHRGSRGDFPENTLPAFARALDLGVTTLELDTGVTRDGVVVIAHDPLLNPDFTRDPQGAWLQSRGPALHTLSFADLQTYDIGRIDPMSAYAKRFPEQRPIDGTRVPALAALFEAVASRGDSRTRFNIETKISPLEPSQTLAPEPFVHAVLGVIRQHGLAHRASLQSFDWRTLKIAQRIAPDIPTVYLTAQQKFLDNIEAANPDGSAWTAGLRFQDHGSVPRMVKAAGGAAWSPYYGDVSAALIAESHALGIPVVVWTVNEPKDIERMLDWKADGIISDYPARVIEAIKKRGWRVK
jgi:glycerophosphoryl diester phosphodiesterase